MLYLSASQVNAYLLAFSQVSTHGEETFNDSLLVSIHDAVSKWSTTVSLPLSLVMKCFVTPHCAEIFNYSVFVCIHGNELFLSLPIVLKSSTTSSLHLSMALKSFRYSPLCWNDQLQSLRLCPRCWNVCVALHGAVIVNYSLSGSIRGAAEKFNYSPSASIRGPEKVSVTPHCAEIINYSLSVSLRGAEVINYSIYVSIRGAEIVSVTYKCSISLCVCPLCWSSQTPLPFLMKIGGF